MWSCLNGLKPILLMMIVQFAFAGVNILIKIAANDGMNPRILVAYRFLFATAFIVPLAFFVERKSRPKLTWTVLGYAFICGLLGGSLMQNLHLESLILTSVTYATAVSNLVPVVTFILAISFRLERLSIKTLPGKAKIIGTLFGIVGAMLLTFYKGIEIKLCTVNNHFQKTNDHHAVHYHEHGNHLLGAFLSLAACVSYSAWLIIQAKMTQRYPCYYSSAALICTMGAIQSTVFALFEERNWNQWKLGWNVRLLTVAYTGMIASGLMVTIMAWCISLRGPMFVSAFNPLALVIVAFAGCFMLNEKLYLGSFLGGFLIVLGIYGVLWGKGKEMKEDISSSVSQKDHVTLAKSTP